jgi:tetratricopeptide (TPR) repeat protein
VRSSHPSPAVTEPPSASATSVAPDVAPPTAITPAASPTPTAAPLPEKASLAGIVHEYQQWNNCGPANLSMALSFWGWQGSQNDTAAFLKPNPRDKNVMPYEMANYVNEMTGLKALVRFGGDVQLLKTFIAAGFPVIIEKGFEGPNFPGWMGHYEVVNAYDDGRGRFTVQDSYIMADLPIPYDELEYHWQAFNYVYIIMYPPEREAEVMSILGPHADEIDNYRSAAEKASQEIFASSERELYFAWYNRGTNLMYLQDYIGAAAAYDEAFKLYPPIPEKQRPWRMLWYQTGPYFAYFFSQRYYDVINLATTTIDTAPEPAIEESFYWRARAYIELYRLDNSKSDYLQIAIGDLQTSLKWHSGFGPSLALLQELGVSE